jgi:RimJ/RimL family protein N-acetyltransferase
MANAAYLKKPRKLEAELDHLVGERTVLRRVMAADLPVLYGWDVDPEIVALMGRKYADKPIEEWFRTLATDRTNRTWVIESLEGRLIGELELAQLNWRTGSAELRICIGDRDYWGHGYGSDAIRTALGAAFAVMQLRSVYLRVFVSNARAVHVYEKLGFRRQAILEASSRRQDPSAVLLMNLTRQRWDMKQSVSA